MTGADPLHAPFAQASTELPPLAAFVREAQARWRLPLPDEAALRAWSAAAPAQFWTSLWHFARVIGSPAGHCHSAGSPGRCASEAAGVCFVREHARLNFAQNLLRTRDEHDALVFWGEDRIQNRLTRGELYREVARLAAALREMRIAPGERIAAWLPNLPEAVIALLAAASVGAVFVAVPASCDARAALAQLAPHQPKLLIAADGVIQGGVARDNMAALAGLAGALPTLRRVLVVPHLHATHDLRSIPHAHRLGDFLALHHAATEIEFEELPFAQPLYAPAAVGEGGAGDTLLHALRDQLLDIGIRFGHRVGLAGECGSAGWYWAVAALAAGAALLLYDGAPASGGEPFLFDYAEAEAMSHLVLSAGQLDALIRAGGGPRPSHSLDPLRAVCLTGGPFTAQHAQWLRRTLNPALSLHTPTAPIPATSPEEPRPC